MTDKPNLMKLAVLGMTGDQAIEQPVAKRSTVKNIAKKKIIRSQPPNSRDNKRHIGGFFDPVVSKQLKILAAESDETIQSLLEEALNDLFNKHGKSSLA